VQPPWRTLWLLTGLGVVHGGHAQELEPRAYSPSPVGLNFVLLSATHTTGDILFDPSGPVSNVDAHMNAAVAGYGHTFGLFDHLASVTLAVPYAWGKISGNVGEDRHEIHRSGLGDAQFRFAVNLIGGPALTPKEFAVRTPQTTLGVSLTVTPPVGQYDATKVINIGSNRWALRPQIGISYPTGRWYLEGYAGAWFFTKNEDYYGGVGREQQPIETLQGHVSYTIQPRAWVAADYTYYAGGRNTVNGIENQDRQSNSRVGLTLSVPAGRTQSIKFLWSKGTSVSAGGDFTTYAIAWQYAWFD
jgi:hypothetical protein